jgi:hypothetical protein
MCILSCNYCQRCLCLVILCLEWRLVVLYLKWCPLEHSRTNARVALQKGIKDNNGFQKFGRTIRTEITCVTKVKEMHVAVKE